ncbi:hypothetical protein [Paraburkholderia sacchari]|uniref:hypothetical protein n=1 Tax=Paraburkholderia sacchari TaxID=159450 RepID=UPI001BCAAFC6|nr:hypothetical protein [Paraburkholderia sacchari]
MAAMTLTIDVVIPHVEMSGRYRNRPVVITGPATIDKTVLAVRRIYEDGVLDEERVEVEFFVPEGERRLYEISRMKRAMWVGDTGVLRTTAQIKNNRKTLAAWLASDERELRFFDH